jgi:hypothetical protein
MGALTLPASGLVYIGTKTLISCDDGSNAVGYNPRR